MSCILGNAGLHQSKLRLHFVVVELGSSSTERTLAALRSIMKKEFKSLFSSYLDFLISTRRWWPRRNQSRAKS